MRKLLGAVTFLIIVMAASPASAAGDVNCGDFGTRERAQHEFEKKPVDVHDLDRDDDGKACEANGSTGWWPWPIASIGLVIGRGMARRRAGDHHMVQGWEGFLFNYRFTDGDHVDKVLDRMVAVLAMSGVIALPVMNMLRDWVLPRSTTPLAVYLLAGALATMGSYVVAFRGRAIADVS